jgi:cytochrome c-type biogenesis protein
VGELLAVFGAGVASAASPCLLPLYPGFLAYLSANAGALSGRRGTGLLGLLVLGGVLTTMIAVGVFLLAISVPVGQVAVYLIPVIDAFLVSLGLLLLLGRNPFQRLPGTQVPLVANPYGQAYVYGVMLGPLALPCAGPFLVALLALSVGLGDAALRLGTFVVFGLGFGLPLLILSVLAGARQQAIVRWTVRHHRAIEIVAGVVLIAVALYDLRENWENLAFTFGF